MRVLGLRALARVVCATAVAIVGGEAFGQATLSFQNGVGGYAGTVDRRMDIVVSEGGSITDVSQNGADDDTTTSSFFIDGDPEDANRSDYLVRFDDIVGGAGVPSGAVILGASLELRTTSSEVSGNSQTGESYNVYRLAQPFDENSSTLDGDFGNGDGMFTNFVDGVEPEQGEADFNTGTFDHPIDESEMAVDQSYAADVTRAVQSWVDGATNYGLAVVSDHRDNDDGWSVHSTGSAVPTYRPKLSVTYTTNPSVRVHEFQDGHNGYDGTADVLLNVVTDTGGTPERDDDTVVGGIDASTESELFLDGDNGEDSYDTPYLIRFDDLAAGGLEAGREVMKAELILKTGVTSGFSDSPGPFSVHQMLTPFDTSSVYGDFSGDVAAMEAAGEIGPAVAQYESIDEAELVSADVTEVVQNWLDGDPNHGIYIGADGTANGWQIFTSAAADPDLAPMLRVTTVPEPASLVLLAGAFGLAAHTRARRARRESV